MRTNLALLQAYALPLALALGRLAGTAATDQIPPAFGPHVNLPATAFEYVPTFSTKDKLVATYYFYTFSSTQGGLGAGRASNGESYGMVKCTCGRDGTAWRLGQKKGESA